MVSMVGTTTRQWYRMSVAETLRELAVDPTLGVTDVSVRQVNNPYFIPKNLRHLYRYSVLRNGTHKKRTIDKLVIGDIVALRSGDIVPADIRLVTAKSVTVLEDGITGNAAPVHKYTFASKALLPMNEQKNMLFAGSEVLSGVAIGVIVRTSSGSKATKNTAHAANLNKRGVLIKDQHVKKIVPLVDCIVFDDLQQKQEILLLIQKLYLEKSIKCIFFVKNSIAAHIKEHLPETIIHSHEGYSEHSGVLVYADLTDAKKAQILATYKKTGTVVMYVHRGEERGLLPRIADINFVISSTATQAALSRADLIAPKISINALASILHNKK